MCCQNIPSPSEKAYFKTVKAGLPTYGSSVESAFPDRLDPVAGLSAMQSTYSNTAAGAVPDSNRLPFIGTTQENMRLYTETNTATYIKFNV